MGKIGKDVTYFQNIGHFRHFYNSPSAPPPSNQIPEYAPAQKILIYNDVYQPKSDYILYFLH